MPAQLVSSKITGHRIKFKVNDKDVDIALTMDCFVWKISIYNEKEKLTLEELIEICNLIYSEKIIDGNDCIKIGLNGNEAYIRGKDQVTSEILKAINVSLSGKI